MALFGLGKKKMAKAVEDSSPKKAKLAVGGSPDRPRPVADVGEETSVVKDAEVSTSAEPESKRKQGEKSDIAKGTAAIVMTQAGNRNVSSVLLRPRITEKATIQSENNVYVFEVSPSATKSEVKEAMSYVYKVNPVKVNIVCVAPRNVFSRMRGRRGQKSGLRKAYVYLKKGERIEVV